MVMVRSLSIAVGVGFLVCALGAPAAAQPFAPDVAVPRDFPALPPDFDEKVNTAIEKAMEKANEAIEKAQEKTQEKMFAFQDANPRPLPNVSVKVGPVPPMPPVTFGGAPADVLYQEARDSIDRERYDLALRRLGDLLKQFDGKTQPIEHRVDAALYWKAYTLGKEQQFSEALNTIADMQKRFSESRWLKDARALELELRQASGQAVSPDGQNDEELKLLALRGVMRSDPDRAVPMIEQLLAGNSSVTVKENALFVLSQSQAPRAREIIINTARSANNPDLQLKAVRYVGAMRTPESAQTLADIYRTSNDVAVKRAIIRAIASGGNSDRLRSMYSAETAPELKREIINSLYSQKDAAVLVEMARAEKDPAMKKEIVSRLSTMRSKEATDYMLELLK
jgi:HEAT repeat protein